MMELTEKLDAKRIIQMSKVRYSTQYVIEVLNAHCFDDIRQSGNNYYCNRPGAKEIIFRELFGGNHVFYIGEVKCDSVYEAINVAGAK